MAKNVKYIMFSDNCHQQIKILSSETGDPEKLFQQACDEAEKDGYRGINSALDKKYLEAVGVEMEDLRTQEMPYIFIGKKRPVYVCRCDRCLDYAEGLCPVFADRGDGSEPSIRTKCIHEINARQLFHNGQLVIDTDFNSEYGPNETAEYILNSEDPELLELQHEIKNYINWLGETPTDGWSFEDNK